MKPGPKHLTNINHIFIWVLPKKPEVKKKKVKEVKVSNSLLNAVSKKIQLKIHPKSKKPNRKASSKKNVNSLEIVNV